VSGVGAKDIMAIASPLDFYETKFRENSVTFSEVFGIKALIKRVENGFEFGADQSYGDMVEDYLHKSVKL
jgi:sarcosine oxidase subunit gamma